MANSDSRALAASRLGDLPNCGYSTAKERESSDAIMLFMRGVERQRDWLLKIVIGGREAWHQIAGKIWGADSSGRGLLITHEKLNEMFDYFVQQAGANPEQQLETLALMAKWSPAQRTGLLPKESPRPFQRSESEIRDIIARVNHHNRYGG